MSGAFAAGHMQVQQLGSLRDFVGRTQTAAIAHTGHRTVRTAGMHSRHAQQQHQPQQHSGCSRRRHSLPVSAAALAVAAAAPAKLQELDLVPTINLQGMIQPDVPEGTLASVFAIFDEAKKLQFVGFSKDLRNSLRTVFSRRPDKAFFYKALNLPRLDQNEMVDIRNAWFEEVGGPPTGNKLAMERAAWSEPVEAGAISERGRLQAAEGQVEELLKLIRGRGCKEAFMPNPALLQEGKVDFLPTAAMTPEELEKQRAALAALAKATRVVDFSLDGEPAQFEMRIRNDYTTNGGHMIDLNVTFEDKETNHRVIVGREYYEDFGLAPEEVLAMTFSFLLRKKVPRQTEGMLLSSQFNINYFAISEVDQWFTDYADEYAQIGKTLAGEGKFWRMNRLHGYGGFAWDVESGLKQEQQLMLNAQT